MFAKLNKIGELTKILSVKSETSDAIMHFMRCFGIGRILSKHSLDKMRGRDMAEQMGQRFNQYEALGELFRETRRELFELTQWRRTLEIIKNLLNVLAVKLCINVADTMENLMEGTQTVGELEAILLALSPLDAVADY